MSSSDSPEPAAGTPEEADARHEGFLAENLIDFGSFELRTKILAGTAVVVLLAAAAFIAAVNAVGGRSVVSVAVSQYGVLGAATGAISPPVVVAVDIALAVVFIMFTTATMHSRDDFVFLAGPFAFGFFAVGFMRTPADWLVLGPPVVVLEFMCYRLWVSSGLERSKGEPERPLPAGAILLVVLCVAAFFGLGLWKLGYSQLTTLMILRVRIGVEWLLVPVLILVGTDFGEATDAVSVIIVEHLARPIAKVAIPWVVIAAGLAGLLIADAVVVSGRWFLFLLPFAALVTAYSAVVVRRSGLPAGAAKHPPRGVVIALGIVGAICLVPDAFNDHNSVVAVGWGWGGAFVLYAFPVSWYFLRRGSAAGGGSADGEPSMLPFVAVFAFAVLVGATFFVGHATRAPLQFSNLLAVVAGSFGVAVIAGLVWLLARRAPGPLLAEAARAMTRALIGIIGLLLLDHVFASAASVSDSTAAAQAVIVVLSLLWDFAMSGAITNGTGESFPRHTRVALYGAYVLAVTAAVLLLSPLRVGSAVQRQAFTPELFPRYGILILAMPILAGLALPAFVRASIKHGTAAEKERPASRKALARIPKWAPKTQNMWKFRLAGLGLILVLLGGSWWTIYRQLLDITDGPAHPLGWSTWWSADGEYSLSYPLGWKPIAASGWDIDAGDFRHRDPVGVAVRAVEMPPGESLNQVVADAVRSSSFGGAKKWTEELPAGPAVFFSWQTRYPLTNDAMTNVVAYITHENQIYVMHFIGPAAQYSARGSVPNKIFRALYFPS